MVPKFRAWHMPFGPKGPMQEMVYGKASSILAFAEMSPDEYIVEQSTGLKDANGKEIYENDIVKVFAVDDPGDYYHAPVKYWMDDNYPAFDIDTKYVPSMRWYDANILSTISESGSENIEVIGNIHENPELLEES